MQPDPVKLIIAATFIERKLLGQCLDTLTGRYGVVDSESNSFDFDHTDYYEVEMGGNLTKQFVSLYPLIQPNDLIEVKQRCMSLEESTAFDNGNRRINLDPAYLELAKLVVATTKNFDHRIYLGKGIYGDVQLRFREGKFIFNDWTYADYKSQPVLRFLETVRGTYFKQLKALK